MSRLLLGAAVCAAGVLASASDSFAALILASDNSANYSSGGWGPGTNQGTGWGGAWSFRNQSNVLLTGTNGNRGWFRGDSRANNSGGVSGDSNGDSDINTPVSGSGTAWGIYSNSTDHVYAIRPFANPLAVGQTVTWFMDNGNISSGNVVGVRLLSNASDANSRVFEARFVGGQSNYTLFDSSGERATTLGFTREGMRVDYTLTGPSTFNVTLTRLLGGSQTLSGTNANANSIVALAFRNQLAGSGASNDAFFNSISIQRPNSAPTVDDHEIFNVMANDPGNNPILHTFTASDPDPADATLSWSNFQLDTYTAAYGGAGSGPVIAATFDPNTRQFSWDTTGSPRGIYVWRIDASDPQFTDTGYLTIHVTAVPEPAAWLTFGLGVLLAAALRRTGGEPRCRA